MADTIVTVGMVQAVLAVLVMRVEAQSLKKGGGKRGW